MSQANPVRKNWSASAWVEAELEATRSLLDLTEPDAMTYLLGAACQPGYGNLDSKEREMARLYLEEKVQNEKDDRIVLDALHSHGLPMFRLALWIKWSDQSQEPRFNTALRRLLKTRKVRSWRQGREAVYALTRIGKTHL